MPAVQVKSRRKRFIVSRETISRETINRRAANPGRSWVDRPNANGRVLTGARQRFALRRESQGIDFRRMPFQRLLPFAGLHVPETHLAIPPTGCDRLTVGRKGHTSSPRTASPEGTKERALLCVPNLNLIASFSAAAGEHLAVWRHSNTIDIFVMLESMLQFPR